MLGHWGIHVEAKRKWTPTLDHTIKQLQVDHRPKLERQTNIVLEGNMEDLHDLGVEKILLNKIQSY